MSNKFPASHGCPSPSALDDLKKNLSDTNKRLDGCVAYLKEDYPAEASSVNQHVFKIKKYLSQLEGDVKNESK